MRNAWAMSRAMLRYKVRRAFTSASCNRITSAAVLRRNSITPSSCKPRLMFQLTTRIVAAGKKASAAMNEPVSICSITSHPDNELQTSVPLGIQQIAPQRLAAAAELADNVPGFASLGENAITEYAEIIHARFAPTAPTQMGIQVRFKSANARSA